MNNRRDFLRAFAVGSIGMAAAEKIGFFQELLNWWNAPARTILIPSPRPAIWWNESAEIVVPSGWDTVYVFSRGVAEGKLGKVWFAEAKTAGGVELPTQRSSIALTVENNAKPVQIPIEIAQG